MANDKAQSDLPMNTGPFFRPSEESQTISTAIVGNLIFIRLSGYGGVSLNKEEAKAVYNKIGEWLGKD